MEKQVSKFRFYITDLYDGCIKGTDDPETAAETAESEDFFVVDTETGELLLPGRESQSIEEMRYE
jgi:hypothetical protein